MLCAVGWRECGAQDSPHQTILHVGQVGMSLITYAGVCEVVASHTERSIRGRGLDPQSIETVCCSVTESNPLARNTTTAAQAHIPARYHRN